MGEKRKIEHTYELIRCIPVLRNEMRTEGAKEGRKIDRKKERKIKSLTGNDV